jgi:hypothetical protein
VKKRSLVGIAGFLFGLSILAPAALGAQPQPPGPGSLAPASDLPPSHGGPGAPTGARSLNARALAAAKAGANARGGGGKPGGGGGGSGTVVTSYPDVSPSFNGIYQTGLTPPDTTGAIGPDRYVETINTKYAIYTRTGSLINSGSLSALTGISSGIFGYSLSDPQMMWDAKTQRFYYTTVYYDAFLFDTGIAIGWSKTATPASSSDFCKYVIGSGSELPDYPKLGDSPGFLIIGYNLFGNGASTYDGSEITTLNKPPDGSACAPTSAFAIGGSGTLYNSDGSLAATPVPANLVDDSNGTGYVVANADLTTTPSANFASVYAVSTHTPATSPPTADISGPTNVTLPESYSIPANAPQPGTSNVLDTLDGRFEAAVAAIDNGQLAVWTAHAVARAGGGGAEERWYEINPAGSVMQSGKVTNDSLYIWNGAVSPDRNGTSGLFGSGMAMSVSTSSTSSNPAIQFVTKPAGGSQTVLKNIVQSGGPNIDFSCSPCRWGDYSGASPDPAATTAGKVWLANQYNLAGGSTSGVSWRTWVFGVTP